MSAIGPGDWVECVDVSPRKHSGPLILADLKKLRVGAIYRVAWVGLTPNQREPGIRLVEVKCARPNMAWRPERFKPIYRPRADLIETLLAPVDHLEPA